ncbi:hypothetical protein Ocin01_06030 [Orchesella cincta]|uniref:Uncharacterized protein n=1 Tax=Orchesella cincta TaxID=48709 RepID=A0A1D2N5V1_ORCCI|nr:hypothetical protein Ocin01_06030 [Orchesella cincta]
MCNWNQLRAIAMSAEAQRRLEEDLRFLESINVWHLVNLRSNHPSLYSYGENLDLLSLPQHRAYPQSPYQHQTSTYLHENRYLPSPGNHDSISSISPSSALPYPDLIVHASDIGSENVRLPTIKTNQFNINGMLVKDADTRAYNSVSFQDNNSTASLTPPSTPLMQHSPRLRPLSILTKEPEDYDADYAIVENRMDSDDKKTVKFTEDTVFVERDMESPFWRAFSERRRLRRIMKQKKQLNAQIASASYQPSILDIVKSAFKTKDPNGNTTKRKGGVLVYDNSNQAPELFAAQYICTTPRRSKLFRILTCTCCTSGPCFI